MNIIITAGGTRERIDSVRSITNEATGRLGSLIAEEFSSRLIEKEHQIYYLCGIGAAIPNGKDTDLKVIRIEGTAQLLQEMKELLTTRDIHAVIHSMAVSDYRVNSVTTLEILAQIMSRKIRESFENASDLEWQTAILEALREQTLEENKISSSLEHPLLLLEKTPKIIHTIKEISPKTKLVGFKLLSGVGREQLIETAFGLLQRNKCDYVLANDTDEINEEKHVGYLVDKNGDFQTFISKAEIAKGIADSIFTKGVME